jgi:ABC-type lipoprotein release transport system permease subunit
VTIVEILFIGAVGASIGLFLGVVLTLVAFRNQR